MYQPRKNKISVKKIANFLKKEYTGKDFDITSISSLNNIKNNSLLFYTDMINFKFELKDNVSYDLKKLEKFKNVVLIASDEFKEKVDVPIISSENPRLDFQRVVMKFFTDYEFESGVHPTAIVEKTASIGKNVYIGTHCYIGNNVTIGDNSKIFANTVIYGKTKIGSNSVILSNSSIGTEGFNYSYTGKELFHFPSLGSIIIGDNVWIGSNCTVEKPQIDTTTIENHVKIDESVQIGHNVVIKKFTQITAGSIICGRAKIGEGCWIAPNVVVENGCQVGKNSIVGSCSLVRTNFPKNSVIIGSPAKILRKRC